MDPFGPFLMKHKIYQAGMTFENEAEKIPCLAFVPIRRMDDPANAWNGFFGLI